MISPIFRWLHFSDLHAGLSMGRWLWPSFKEKFLGDIEIQFEKSGPWDAVFFTGDLTQTGRRLEYDQLDDILAEIWLKFSSMNIDPALVTIPGNHDLTRPDELASQAVALGNYWKTPLLQEKLLAGKAEEYVRFLEKVFAEYSAWRDRLVEQGRHAPPASVGLLPGDASYRIAVGEHQIGIVGLNSAWLQLDAGNYVEKLAVDARQLLAITGNEPDNWCRENSANFLLTHHPVAWLHPDSAKYWQSDIDTNRRFDLHLFGHMHDNDMTSISHGGAPARRSAQASSLLGLEWVREETLERIQGYSLNILSENQESRSLTVWPRILVKQKDGDLKITSDTSQSLIDDQYYKITYETSPKKKLILQKTEFQDVHLSLASKPDDIATELEKV